MPTFIDESGDTGLCHESGSSHFRLAAVWTPAHESAEVIRRAIRDARHAIGVRTDYEFKFAHTWSHPERREAFFKAAMNHEFRFAFASLDKNCGFNCSRELARFCHWATTTELAATLRPVYLRSYLARRETDQPKPFQELVVVDDNRDKEFLKIVKTQFRGLGQSLDPKVSLVGKVKFGNSAPEELTQLADMVCGACAAMADGKERKWYKLIAERDLNLRVLR